MDRVPAAEPDKAGSYTPASKVGPRVTAHPMMSGDCPRCGAARTTFDVPSSTQIAWFWPQEWELFVQCRKCGKSSIFRAIPKSSNSTTLDKLAGSYIDHDYKTEPLPPIIPAARTCPDHVPAEIKRIFDEAAKAHATKCFDAAGTMFRKVLDASTRTLIEGEPQTLEKTDPNYISWKTYKDLGLRLEWLFERRRLPESLKPLASCVHQDGNDAAHALSGIGELEAADLADFTVDFLDTIYTRPGRLAESERRRAARRGQTQEA